MIQIAHRFLRALRADAGLRARVADLGPDAGLDEIAALAADAGHACDPESLREAWRQDWTLRWLANGSATGNRASSARASDE